MHHQFKFQCRFPFVNMIKTPYNKRVTTNAINKSTMINIHLSFEEKIQNHGGKTGLTILQQLAVISLEVCHLTKVQGQGTEKQVISSKI